MQATNSESKLFYNANFITLDDRYPRAEAMLVTGERIAAIGTLEAVTTAAPVEAERIDLNGLTVVPGFNDSHLHLLNWGLSMAGIDLTQVRSIHEMIALGRNYLQTQPDARVIMGRGWSDEKFDSKRLPNRWDLDQIARDVPVLFTRVCGHVCAVNSKALELAGINANTDNPAGGSIDRDPLSGEPTGILRETAIELIYKLIPTPSISELKGILRGAAQAAAAVGLTSVQANDIQGAAGLSTQLEAYRQLAEADELPIRVNLQASMPTLSDITSYLAAVEGSRDFGTYLDLGPVKLYADGSLGAKTAAMSEPYLDAPETRGVPIYSQPELDELVLAAAQADLQVAVHAIGDWALDMVLTSYAKAKAAVPAWSKRPRVVHCQIARLEQLERMAELRVVADIQPIFVPTDRHFVEARIGTTRARYAYAWKTMVELGIATAGSSDCPIENCNPLLGLQAAITRDGWHPEECLTPLAALKLFTIGSAYAAHEENEKGTLSPGKLADFVVLPQDPLTVEPEALGQMEVAATYVGGRRVTQ